MNDFKMEVTALEGLLYETHFFASREIVISRCNISLLPRAMLLASTLCLILRQLLHPPRFSAATPAIPNAVLGLTSSSPRCTSKIFLSNP
jgi:hypothetical protein